MGNLVDKLREVLHDYENLSKRYQIVIKRQIELLNIIKELEICYPQFLFEITTREKLIDIMKGDK